jgi:hypothetical protein
MLDPRLLEQFCNAHRWLCRFPKTKNFNARGTSYRLKHMAEPTIGYVTDGMFICAAIAKNFRVQRGLGSPNVWLAISTLA